MFPLHAPADEGIGFAFADAAQGIEIVRSAKSNSGILSAWFESLLDRLTMRGNWTRRAPSKSRRNRQHFDTPGPISE